MLYTGSLTNSISDVRLQTNAVGIFIISTQTRTIHYDPKKQSELLDLDHLREPHSFYNYFTKSINLEQLTLFVYIVGIHARTNKYVCIR